MTRAEAANQTPFQPVIDAFGHELAPDNERLDKEIAERRRLEAAVREYAQRLDHQRATQLAILSAQSLTDTLDISINHIKNQLPCLSATIVSFDFDRHEVNILRSSRPELAPGQRLPILLPEYIKKLQPGDHFYMADIGDLIALSPRLQAAARPDDRSLLMIPMHYRDKLIGAMNITTSLDRDFTDNELVIAQEIGASLAIAIQYRHWLEAEQQAREREATLREVAQSLTANLEPDIVLRGILDQLQTIVPTASSAIFLHEDDHVLVAASRGLRSDEGAMAQFVADLPPMLRTLLESGKARVINDTTQAPDWVIVEGGDYIRSWLGIPLIVKNKTIGILTLDRDTAESFDEEDLEVATILAAQAAIAIENARLFKREQESAARLEREVRDRTKELEALFEISGAANENLDQELLLDFSLSRVLKALDYDAGAIHLLDDETGQLTRASTLGIPRAVLAALKQDIPPGWLLDRHLAYMNGPRSLDTSELAGSTIWSGFASCTIAPLQAHGQPMGIILLMSRDKRPLTPGNRNLVIALADQIGLAIESTDLRRQARQTAVLAERERIARDLHDVVTQSLYSLVLFAEAARETAITGDMDEVNKNVISIMKTAHEVLGEMRVLLYDLRSDVLATKGLRIALAERLATVEQRAGFVTELQVERADELPPELEDVLYRVALEALNNAFRHAEAKSVAVHLVVSDETTVLKVTDDGRGFVLTDVADGPGMGLGSMRRRAQDVGGTLLIESVPGQGTQLEFRVPMSQSAATARPAR